MEELALHTGAPTVHWEYNTSFISIFEAKRVTPGLKHMEDQGTLHVSTMEVGGGDYTGGTVTNTKV